MNNLDSVLEQKRKYCSTLSTFSELTSSALSDNEDSSADDSSGDDNSGGDNSNGLIKIMEIAFD